MKPARITRLADLARIAKLSPPTVSRALADSPRVSQETKERVRRLAAEHNYRSNVIARNLRRQTSGAIALVVPVMPETGYMASDPFLLDIIGAVADALQGSGNDLLLVTTAAHPDRWYEEFIASRRVDGLIVVGQAHNGAALHDLARSGAPFVVWGAPAADYCTVGCDNRAGGEIATRHLLDLARRRIAFIGDPALPEVTLRYQGYHDALAAAGLTPDPALLVDVPFTRDGARAGVERLLDSGVGFDAIFAASDLIAMSAIRLLRAHRLDTPSDVAVVGFDDIRSAADYNPPLTTVSQDIPAGGRALVERLLSAIGGTPPAPLTITPELIVRASTVGEARRR